MSALNEIMGAPENTPLDPATGLVLAFDKPYAMTSFRLVSRVRGILCSRLGGGRLRVGHAGTLDPLATGLLLVCTGRATKHIDTLQGGVKEYVATMRLGATTPSFDRETAVDSRRPTAHLTRELVDEALARFTGRIMQTPPAYSAVKVDGHRAFKAARRGERVELRAKELVVDEIEVLGCQLDVAAQRDDWPAVPIKDVEDGEREALRRRPPEGPWLELRIVCSKGTYIRALARDIGEALGCGAYLTQLRRTRIGSHTVTGALDIADFERWVDERGVARAEEAGSRPSETGSLSAVPAAGGGEEEKKENQNATI